MGMGCHTDFVSNRITASAPRRHVEQRSNGGQIMSVQPLPESRRNRLPLPPGLGRRNLPHFGVEELANRAAGFDSLRRVIVRPGPSRPRIVSSAHGPLTHLLLSYPAYAEGQFSYRAVYADLFRKLPDTTRLTVLCHPSVTAELDEELASAGASERATIVEAPEFLEFLVWAEDPYVVVED